MAELKKCPFCGGEAELFQHYPYMRRRVVSSVCCKSCRANSGTWGRKDKAIESWNNRATEAELRASVIDEFAEKIRDWKKEIYTNERYAGELDFLFKHIDEIASQMKGEKE